MHVIGAGGHASVMWDLYDCIPQAFDNRHFVAVGDNKARKKEAEALGGAMFATLIHPKAIVSASAKIGEGTIIMAGAVVQARAVIGKHCIVNTCASVDHDSVLGDYVHIAPGAHLCGGVQVGDGALVGVCVGVEPGVTIPAWATVKRIPYEISLSGDC